ncbi:MAG: peptide deformylase [Lentisphaeria bacterium]|nr:peptide deformylase [Lentisphaeria bacterium]
MLFSPKKRYVVQTLGSEVLRRKAAPIPAVTAEIRELAEYMYQTLRQFDGIGLAAPQVGHSLRLVVLAVPPESMSSPPSPGERELLPQMPLVLVNPEIVDRFGDIAVRDEGCLSVPDIFAPVPRPSRVILRSQTLDGGIITAECGGLLGRCIQHELDHLDGVIFCDRVEPDEKRLIESDMRRLERYGSKHQYQRVITR